MHPDDDDGESRIPIVEEQVVVDKVAAVTDCIRVATTIETREVVIEDILRRGRLDIERMTLDREVREAPPLRQDGDLLIISVVEERLVKRLFVVEEVRVRQTDTSQAVSVPTTLRSMRATIEHPEPSTTGGRLKWQI